MIGKQSCSTLFVVHSPLNNLEVEGFGGRREAIVHISDVVQLFLKVQGVEARVVEVLMERCRRQSSSNQAHLCHTPGPHPSKREYASCQIVGGPRHSRPFPN